MFSVGSPSKSNIRLSEEQTNHLKSKFVKWCIWKVSDCFETDANKLRDKNRGNDSADASRQRKTIHVYDKTGNKGYVKEALEGIFEQR